MGRLYLGNGTGDVDTGSGGGGSGPPNPIVEIGADFVGPSIGLNTAKFTPIVSATRVTIGPGQQVILMGSVEINNGDTSQGVEMQIVDDLDNVYDTTQPTNASYGSLVWTRVLKMGVTVAEQGLRTFTVQGKSTVDNTPTAFNASLVVIVTAY
jgi:hypothetical protein